MIQFVMVIDLDKPSPPGGPLKVQDVTDKSCKLKWNPPADDGGAPVDCYTVEKMDAATGLYFFFQFSIISARTTSVIIKKFSFQGVGYQ